MPHSVTKKGYVDADYAPDYGAAFANYKSTTGWIFTINDVAFSWRSRKQTLLADSTSASELMAATDASKHSVWLRRLFADLGFPQHGPTFVLRGCDSISLVPYVPGTILATICCTCESARG